MSACCDAQPYYPSVGEIGKRGSTAIGGTASKRRHPLGDASLFVLVVARSIHNRADGREPACAGGNRLSGVAHLMAAVAARILQQAIRRKHVDDPLLTEAAGADLKGMLLPMLPVLASGPLFYNGGSRRR